MKKHIIYLFCLIAFSSTSQNILSEKYNLMPWPQNIEENNLRLVINSDVTISIIGNDNQE